MAFDPGSNLTSRNRFAQMLLQQEQAAPPIQSHTQGLASLLRQGMAGYLQGADVRDRATAYKTMMDALQNPGQAPQAMPQGVSGPPQLAPQDPYTAASTALGNLGPDNEYAPMLGQQMALSGMQRQQQLADQQRQFEMQKDLYKTKLANDLPTGMRPGPKGPEYIPGYIEGQSKIYGLRAAATRPNWEQTTDQATGLPVQVNTLTGEKKAIPGASGMASPKKPMPASIVKAQSDMIEDFKVAQNMQPRLSRFVTDIDEGRLDLGLVSNLANKARNMVGMSSEESRTLASFSADLNKLRNDSLRLNKGVQTEGDAQRAWDELINNINDPAVVRQRLEEIIALNNQAEMLKRDQIDLMRSEYGREPLPYTNTGGKGNTSSSSAQDEWETVQ